MPTDRDMIDRVLAYERELISPDPDPDATTDAALAIIRSLEGELRARVIAGDMAGTIDLPAAHVDVLLRYVRGCVREIVHLRDELALVAPPPKIGPDERA